MQCKLLDISFNDNEFSLHVKVSVSEHSRDNIIYYCKHTLCCPLESEDLAHSSCKILSGDSVCSFRYTRRCERKFFGSDKLDFP